jgi:endonuclease III
MIKDTQSLRKEKVNIEYETQNSNSDSSGSSMFDLSSLKYSCLKESIKSLEGYSSAKKSKVNLKQEEEVIQKEKLMEEQIQKIEKFVNKNSPLSKIIKDIQKQKTDPHTYELYKFRTLVVLIFAETDSKQINLKEFYDSTLKRYAFTLEEMTKFTDEEYKKFTQHALMKLAVKKRLKTMIKTLISKFNRCIPENYSDLKQLELKDVVILEFYKQLKGFYPKEEDTFFITYGIFRIANRLGWIDSDIAFADSLEEIKKKIPKKYHCKIFSLNQFSYFFCVHRMPTCSECPVNDSCKFNIEVTNAKNSGKYLFFVKGALLPLNLIPKEFSNNEVDKSEEEENEDEDEKSD